MPFLENDEFIILMNPNLHVMDNWGAPKPLYVPTLECRQRYRDAGIKTAVERPIWSEIEPKQGEYDFSTIEEMLYLNRNADQKTIFHVYTAKTPTWLPDDWIATEQDGKLTYWRAALSLWNKDAQRHIEGYCKMLVDKYSAPDVMFIMGGYADNEAILPVAPAFYDRAALESYRKMFGADAFPDINSPDTRMWLGIEVLNYCDMMDALLYEPHKELWNMQQFLMNQWSPATGNYMQLSIMAGQQGKYSPLHQTLLQYTYYDHAHGKENEAHVDNIAKVTGCDVIVEAHYCKGLRETAPKSIKKGFRGQIVCPTHQQSGSALPEDWMFSEIKWAHDLWRSSR